MEKMCNKIQVHVVHGSFLVLYESGTSGDMYIMYAWASSDL